MHRSFATILSGCAALLAAGLAACGGGGDAAGMSTLNLGLTDAPVSGVTKVWISFTGVELKPASGDAVDFSFTPAKGFDLLSLQGGVTASFLNGATIPAGEYQWVRLMVDTSAGPVTSSTPTASTT